MKALAWSVPILQVLHWFGRLRVWLALVAIGQGIVRVAGGTALVLSWGNISFGWFMLGAGAWVLATYRRRLLPIGRLAAVGLAAVYAVLAAASSANLATAYTALMIAAAMLAEAGSAQSDC